MPSATLCKTKFSMFADIARIRVQKHFNKHHLSQGRDLFEITCAPADAFFYLWLPASPFLTSVSVRRRQWIVTPARDRVLSTRFFFSIGATQHNILMRLRCADQTRVEIIYIWCGCADHPGDLYRQTQAHISLGANRWPLSRKMSQQRRVIRECDHCEPRACVCVCDVIYSTTCGVLLNQFCVL